MKYPNKCQGTIIFALLICTSLSFALAAQSPRISPAMDWVSTELRQATSLMLKNVSPTGAARGAVIASPSQTGPNYYFAWIRDAALTMDTVETLYETSNNSRDANAYYTNLLDYVDFSRLNQLTPNMSGGPDDTGLGEPKFNVDGTAYNEPWGRPQNDGPAIRVSTLTRFANRLIAEGNTQLVRDKLYDNNLPANTVIKNDLEYVAHHWNDPNYDLWEETMGRHFFTSAVQRKGLLDGAALAEKLGDQAAGTYYRQQAKLLESEMSRHWDANKGYIVETLDWQRGLTTKTSNLDSAIVVAALRACAGDGFYCPSNDQVLATAWHLESVFRNLYAINQVGQDSHGDAMAPAIGRYPEDIYSGTGPGVANPWFILTNSFAELCYRAAAEFQAAGTISITALNQPFLAQALAGINAGDTISSSDPRFGNLLAGLKTLGDSFLQRTRYHMDARGSLSEQINRDSGVEQGAHDLTWSYASFLTAAWAGGGATAIQN